MGRPDPATADIARMLADAGHGAVVARSALRAAMPERGRATGQGRLATRRLASRLRAWELRGWLTRTPDTVTVLDPAALADWADRRLLVVARRLLAVTPPSVELVDAARRVIDAAGG